MTDDAEVSLSHVDKTKLCVYAELKWKLCYCHVFLKVSGSRIGEKATLNINRKSVEITWPSTGTHVISFDSALFVPTTCHGIQWVDGNELNFRVQVRELSSNAKQDYINGYASKHASTNGNTTHLNEGPSSANHIEDNSLTSSASLESFRRPNFSFSCQKCSTVLLHPVKFSRVLPLPSDSWHDIADSVFCHKHHPDKKEEGGATASQNGAVNGVGRPNAKQGTIINGGGAGPSVNHGKTTNGMDSHSAEMNGVGEASESVPQKSNPLAPNENDCFVGETHFLLNGTALLQSTMAYDQKSSAIKCSRCRATVGVGQSEQNGILRKSSTRKSPKLNEVQSLKVFKHCVKLPWRHKKEQCGTLDSGNKVQYRSVSVESDVASLIESQCRQYNGYRFVIEARENKSVRPYLLLWVLETECELYSAETNENARDVHATTTRILKVMYKDCLRTKSAVCTDQWQSDLTAHSVELPTQVCLRLVQLLIDSTKLLPSILREANDFYVGFLRKTSSS